MSAPTLWNTKGYNSLLYLKLQEKGKLLNTVMQSEGGFGGAEFKFAEQLGKREVVKITSRIGNTQWQEPDAYRRRIGKESFEYATIIDKIEKLDRLVDPTSKEFMNAQMAFGRNADDIIITAAMGTAYTGEDGGTSTTLPPAQTIAHGSAQMTVAKLLSAMELFNTNNVDPDEKKYGIIGPKEVTAMLNIDKLTSADYASLKNLQAGKIESFMGFEFIMSNRLPVASSIRSCVFYAESGIEVCIDQNMETTVDRLPERRNAIGIQTQMSLGAVRVEEEKVVVIECDES